MTIIECEQYTPEWWELRRGVPTASAFDRIITPAKGELSAQADDYICELIGDRWNQIPNFFSNRRPMNHAMEHGANWEDEARRWYGFHHDAQVRRVGFVRSACGRFGCSPDGLVLGPGGGPAGGLELKCPQPKTHVSYLTGGTLPREYRPQVHGQLVVTGLPWIDFVSYCPFADGPVPSGFSIRVTPNEFTDRVRLALERFMVRFAEVEALLAGPADTPKEAVA